MLEQNEDRKNWLVRYGLLAQMIEDRNTAGRLIVHLNNKIPELANEIIEIQEKRIDKLEEENNYLRGQIRRDEK